MRFPCFRSSPSALILSPLALIAAALMPSTAMAQGGLSGSSSSSCSSDDPVTSTLVFSDGRWGLCKFPLEDDNITTFTLDSSGAQTGKNVTTFTYTEVYAANWNGWRITSAPTSIGISQTTLWFRTRTFENYNPVFGYTDRDGTYSYNLIETCPYSDSEDRATFGTMGYSSDLNPGPIAFDRQAGAEGVAGCGDVENQFADPVILTVGGFSSEFESSCEQYTDPLTSDVYNVHRDGRQVAIGETNAQIQRSYVVEQCGEENFSYTRKARLKIKVDLSSASTGDNCGTAPSTNSKFVTSLSMKNNVNFAAHAKQTVKHTGFITLDTSTNTLGRYGLFDALDGMGAHLFVLGTPYTDPISGDLVTELDGTFEEDVTPTYTDVTTVDNSTDQQTFLYGDVNGDGVVDYNDKLAFAGLFGLTDDDTGYNPRADMNFDGTIDDSDYQLLLALLPNMACNVADIVSAGQQPPPDGILTGDDYTAFINAFFTGSLLADIVSVGQLPPPDGLVTGDDYTAFINAFFTGC